MEASDGTVYWALADNLGSVRDIVAYDSGTGQTSVVNHIEYDAFGNITSETAASGMDYALERYLYSYTGREWDADAQLYAYRARWYDPVVGRFISEDPIGFAAGDTNISRYVGNGVTNATDPSGLNPWVGPSHPAAYFDDTPDWTIPRPATPPPPPRPEYNFTTDDGGWAYTVELWWHYVNPFISHHAVDAGDSACQWAARIGQAGVVVGTGGIVVAKVGAGKAAAFVATEAVETIVEEVTGVPVITDPKDLAEVLTKKGGKKAAQQVDDAYDAANRSPFGPKSLGAAQRPVPKLPANARTASIDEVYRRLGEHHGIPKNLASKRLHEIKEALGYAPDDDLLFDLTGNIFDPKTREWIGSMCEGGQRHHTDVPKAGLLMNRPSISLSLRIVGDALDVAEVTRILGCSPSDARQKGDEVKSSHFIRHARTGVWRLKADCSDGDIDSAVAQLLSKLTTDTGAWAKLASTLRIELFCGVFLRSSNQGFSLNLATLKELTERSITLSFDIYGGDDFPAGWRGQT